MEKKLDQLLMGQRQIIVLLGQRHGRREALRREALQQILQYAKSEFSCSYKSLHDRCLACQKLTEIIKMAKEGLKEE